MFDVGVLLEAPDFSEERVMQICRRVLNRQRASAGMGRILFFAVDTQQFDFQRYSHVPFDRWERRCQKAVNATLPIAEMLLIGDNAGLKYRDTSGVRHIALRGSDPFKQVIPESGFEIVAIDLNVEFGDLIFLVRFERPLSIATATALYSGVAESIPELRFILKIRTDPWFFFHDAYVAPCWWTTAQPASLEEISWAPEITCATSRNSASPCYGARLGP